MSKIKDLFKQVLGRAASQGDVSQPAVQVMQEKGDPGIFAGLAQGISPENLDADVVTILVNMLDSSISMQGNEQVLLDAYGQMVAAFQRAANAESILVGDVGFHSSPYVLRPFTQANRLTSLTQADYVPNGATSLYDTATDVMAGALAYAQGIQDQGIPYRIIFLLWTDGDDTMSSRSNAGDVNTIVTDLRGKEVYTVAMIGLGMGHVQTIASRLGIKNVLEGEPADWKQLFNLVSQAVISTSQRAIGTGDNDDDAFFDATN